MGEDWEEVKHQVLDQLPRFLWTDLGQVGGGRERIGADLTVVRDRLYISGGVDESGRLGFDGSVLRWGGTYADLCAEEDRARRELVAKMHDPEFIPVTHCNHLRENPMAYPPDYPEHDSKGAHRMAQAELGKVEAEQKAKLSSAANLSHFGWATVPGLEMPTAMHAHAALTVPLLPRQHVIRL